MNLGEFIIQIGTQGDTKELQKTIKRLEEAEKKSRGLISYLKKLNQATTEQEKALIKKNYAQQVEIDKLNKTKQNQDALNNTMRSGIKTAFSMVGALAATVTMLDRMGNSLLKANQMYITFGKQTDLSITRLNKMAGIARLSGMNLSAEQVAGDLQGLQQRIFRMGVTGEGSGIFAQLGMNPMGMSPDKFILALRQRLKGQSGQAKSYILNELGLSQEWLNVLDLSNDKFSEYLKMSKELQLTEQERKKLASYTFKQQKNNMRFELAKQKFLISIMPAVQNLMEVTSKIALNLTNAFEKNPPAWLNAVKDVLLLFAASKVINGIKALKGLLAFGGLSLAGAGAKGGAALAGGGLLGLFGKGAAKTGAKIGASAAIKGGLGTASNFMGVAGIILKAALGVWAIYDIVRPFFDKEKEDDENDNMLEPAEAATNYQYHNVKSNMTNNFFNNPQPQQAVINELTNVIDRYTMYQYR